MCDGSEPLTTLDVDLSKRDSVFSVLTPDSFDLLGVRTLCRWSSVSGDDE